MKRLLSVIITSLLLGGLAQAQFSGPSNTRITIRETSKPLPLGLWSIGVQGDSFKIDKNLSGTGNFGLTLNVLAVTGGIVTIPNLATAVVRNGSVGSDSSYFFMDTVSWDLFHSSVNDNFQIRRNNVPSLTVNASGVVGVTTTLSVGTSTLSSAINPLSVFLNDSATGVLDSNNSLISIENDNTTANNYAAFVFRSKDTTGNTVGYGGLGMRFVGTHASQNSDLEFYNKNAAALTTALVLKANGTVQPGTDNTQPLGTASFRWSNVRSTTAQFDRVGLGAAADATFPLLVSGNGDTTVEIATADNTGNPFVRFFRNGTLRGAVFTDGNSALNLSAGAALTSHILISSAGLATFASNITFSGTSPTVYSDVNAFMSILGGNTGGGGVRIQSGTPGSATTRILVDGASGNTTPGADNGQDFGSASFRWQQMFIGVRLQIGTNPAGSGVIRLPNASDIIARTSGNNGDRTLASYGVAATDEESFGDSAAPTRIRSTLAVPASLVNGDWWVECTGTTPTRICAIKVRDGGATRVIATMTY